MSVINMYIKRQDSTPITYEPMTDSKTLALVFLCLFAFATIFTAAKIIRYTKDIKNHIGVVFLYFPAPLIEMVGFLVRILAAANPDNNGLFVANMTLLGTAPLFLTMTSWILFPVLSFHAGLEYSGNKFKPRKMLGPAIIFLISVFHLNIRGLITAYIGLTQSSYLGGGCGIMLGGLGVVIVIEIAQAWFFVDFLRRFFGINSVRENPRITRISVAVAVNIIVLLIRNIYRTVEFSLMLVNSNDDINEIWLYIFDAAPTFVAIMTLAIVHPFELPYLAAFRRNPGETRGCVRRTNTERQRTVRTEPARTEPVPPPPYVRPPSYREGSVSTDDSKAPIKVYDHLQNNIKYYERE